MLRQPDYTTFAKFYDYFELEGTTETAELNAFLTELFHKKNVKRVLDYQNRVVILDNLQDPLNIAKIMEACLLFGFDSIFILASGVVQLSYSSMIFQINQNLNMS